jgi:hypothetical protein
MWYVNLGSIRQKSVSPLTDSVLAGCFWNRDRQSPRKDNGFHQYHQVCIFHPKKYLQDLTTDKLYSVVAAFIIAFCVPYLLNDIGANIGWLFGAISFVAAIYAYFFVPEIKVSGSPNVGFMSILTYQLLQNRSLEVCFLEDGIVSVACNVCCTNLNLYKGTRWIVRGELPYSRT